MSRAFGTPDRFEVYQQVHAPASGAGRAVSWLEVSRAEDALVKLHLERLAWPRRRRLALRCHVRAVHARVVWRLHHRALRFAHPLQRVGGPMWQVAAPVGRAGGGEAVDDGSPLVGSGPGQRAVQRSLGEDEAVARREYGLVEQRFAALHIRESVEKQNELGKKLPSHASYETIAEAVMREYNVSHLFLQTASPGALSELTRWACATRTVLAFTHNPRGEHDSWAGWKKGRQMIEATIAAVNLHIASKAIVFMGIASSMWNYVQLPLLGAGDKPSQIDLKCSDSVWKITVATRAGTPLRASGASCNARKERMPRQKFRRAEITGT